LTEKDRFHYRYQGEKDSPVAEIRITRNLGKINYGTALTRIDETEAFKSHIPVGSQPSSFGTLWLRSKRILLIGLGFV